jgi:hypothetical protein
MKKPMHEHREFHVHFKKEGNNWTAILQESPDPGENPAGYGTTPQEAFNDLFAEKNKEDYQQEVRHKS